jgi:hypothetical protein
MTVAEHGHMKGATENGTAQASVSIAGTTYDLPVRKGTLGPGVVDISTLYQDIGRASTCCICLIDLRDGFHSAGASPASARRPALVPESSSLEQQGEIAFFDEIEWDDDGYWEIEYYTAAGAKVKVKVDPVSGKPSGR